MWDRVYNRTSHSHVVIPALTCGSVRQIDLVYPDCVIVTVHASEKVLGRERGKKLTEWDLHGNAMIQFPMYMVDGFISEEEAEEIWAANDTDQRMLNNAI